MRSCIDLERLLCLPVTLLHVVEVSGHVLLAAARISTIPKLGVLVHGAWYCCVVVATERETVSRYWTMHACAQK
jgi:hypothetical protein